MKIHGNFCANGNENIMEIVESNKNYRQFYWQLDEYGIRSQIKNMPIEKALKCQYSNIMKEENQCFRNWIWLLFGRHSTVI